MNAHLARAQLLLQQSRYDMAEKELRQALAQDSHQAAVHALLALCLLEQDHFVPATEEARAAIELEPDLPLAHYTLGTVLLRRDRLKEAEEAAASALELDPTDAAHHFLMGQLRFRQRRWSAALEAAEAGLACDPTDVDCVNLKAGALVQLGRKEQAGATIQGALERDPENPNTHANQGWACLHQSQVKPALEHFREALRLEPGHEWARAGLVEALKARNPVYGVMLRYFLWMGRLSGRAQWGVVVGGYLAYRALRTVAATNPRLAPWLTPLIVAYVIFAALTWISVPLFNLILRLHPFGRHALDAEQRRASSWFGACLGLALGCLALGLGLGSSLAVFGALTFGILLLPLAAVFNCHAGWPRHVMAAFTAGLLALRIAVAVVVETWSGDPEKGVALISTLNTFFFLGALLASIVANALSGVRPAR